MNDVRQLIFSDTATEHARSCAIVQETKKSTQPDVPATAANMLTRVRVVRFKQFADETFDLTGQSVVLAGPNNSGKTTLLHAIATWHLAVQRWTTAQVRKDRRISVTLEEFTALPLREMNLLWFDRHVSKRGPSGKPPRSAPIYIEVTAKLPDDTTQSLAVELMYANEKLVHVRPVDGVSDPKTIKNLPEFVTAMRVAHVPAFSGIGTQEPRHAPGMQNKLLGEGKAGEIVRNLLLEIWEKSNRDPSKAPWNSLAGDIETLFGFEIMPPDFSDRRPYIVSEYRPKVHDSKTRGPKLDIANAGSGFHQVLLLLSFFYGKPSSILLLDEPDAHLHVILQRQVADHMRQVAASQACKLIIATHAEVLLSDAEPTEVISFVGGHAHRLASHQEKRTVTDALKTLTSLDLLNASHAGAVLYVEDDSDAKLLREWARVLDHPAQAFLNAPYLWPLRGKGNFDNARRHFRCLRLVSPDFAGVCVLDSDGEGAHNPNAGPEGMIVFRWPRYEIENYLLNPQVLSRANGGEDGQMSLWDHIIVDEFKKEFPPVTDWLSDIRALSQIKGSEFIVETLSKAKAGMAKRDLYMLAAKMKPHEIHPDIRRCLDLIASAVPAKSPIMEANEALPDDDNE